MLKRSAPILPISSTGTMVKDQRAACLTKRSLRKALGQELAARVYVLGSEGSAPHSAQER